MYILLMGQDGGPASFARRRSGVPETLLPVSAAPVRPATAADARDVAVPALGLPLSGIPPCSAELVGVNLELVELRTAVSQLREERVHLLQRQTTLETTLAARDAEIASLRAQLAASNKDFHPEADGRKQ